MKKIVKLFIDLDGTICGSECWINWYINTRALFKTGILRLSIPPRHSWKILTARPRIDKFIINRAMRKYKLFPEEIIVGPALFYRFKNSESVANWKSSILSKEADNIFVDKVIYADSNSNMLSKMIKHKNIILCRPDTLNKVLEELEGG